MLNYYMMLAGVAANPPVTEPAATTALTAPTGAEALEYSLELMGQGMGGIFVVMAVISLIVWGITKFSK